MVDGVGAGLRKIVSEAFVRQKEKDGAAVVANKVREGWLADQADQKMKNRIWDCFEKISMWSPSDHTCCTL